MGSLNWGSGPGHRWIVRKKPSGRSSAEVMGDLGPWPSLVPAMWRALADVSGTHAFPKPPKQAEPSDEMIAYWAPLPELLRYSLGWRPSGSQPLNDRVHLGSGIRELLAHEDEFVDDACVRFLLTVWGRDNLLAFAAWALDDRSELDRLSDETYLRDVKSQGLAGPSAASLALIGSDRDVLHLSTHWSSPLSPADRADGADGQDLLALNPEHEPPTAVLVLDRYEGWATALALVGEQLPPPETGRAWRVEVLVRPIGWLGTYRRSTQSGLWFAGRHALHALGH